MDASSELFKGRAFEVFDSSEVNEVLLAAYSELSYAIRDSSDLVILDRKALVHIRDGHIAGRWSMIYGSTSIYDMARKNLLKILELDGKVKQYFQLEYVDENNLRIRIK